LSSWVGTKSRVSNVLKYIYSDPIEEKQITTKTKKQNIKRSKFIKKKVNILKKERKNKKSCDFFPVEFITNKI
jgi:hypothetical protein